MIAAFEQFGEISDVAKIGNGQIFEMLTLPKDVDRQEFIETAHTIPSTGEGRPCLCGYIGNSSSVFEGNYSTLGKLELGGKRATSNELGFGSGTPGGPVVKRLDVVSNRTIPTIRNRKPTARTSRIRTICGMVSDRFTLVGCNFRR